MNFCKDCKHFRAHLKVRVPDPATQSSSRLDEQYRACDLLSRDPVMGEYRVVWKCDIARDDYPGYCGPEGRFFAPLPRPIQPPIGDAQSQVKP